jgi:hypothetical protein
MLTTSAPRRLPRSRTRTGAGRVLEEQVHDRAAVHQVERLGRLPVEVDEGVGEVQQSKRGGRVEIAGGQEMDGLEFTQRARDLQPLVMHDLQIATARVLDPPLLALGVSRACRSSAPLQDPAGRHLVHDLCPALAIDVVLLD